MKYLFNVKFLAVLLALYAIVSAAHPAYLVVKAEVAQLMLLHAWKNTQSLNSKQRPWYWADTYPVAMITVEKSDDSLVVLAGMNGRTMAFGPGWLEHSATPNSFGNSVVSAHNDSHFEVLQHVEVGDTIKVENSHKIAFNYKIVGIDIVDENARHWNTETEHRMLTLITCYPFDGITESKQRMIVRAIAV